MVSLDVIEECPPGDLDFLLQREIYWIAHFREIQGSLSNKSTEDYLKNVQDGGGSGNFGIELSEEHKKSISEGVNKHFDENGHKPVYDFWVDKFGEEEATRLLESKRQKASSTLSGSGNPMYGRSGQNAPCYGRVGEKHPMFGTHHSEASRKKISDSSKGRKKSEATKLRMSFAQHTRSHGENSKETCIWCNGADLQNEIQKKENKQNGSNME